MNARKTFKYTTMERSSYAGATMKARKAFGYVAMAVLALGAAGCGDPFSNRLFEEDQAFLDALPRSEQVEIESPDDSSVARAESGAAKAGGSATGRAYNASQDEAGTSVLLKSDAEDACPIDDPAYDRWRLNIVDMVQDVNGFVKDVLTTLDRVRTYPPSERTADTRTWGPVEMQPDVTGYIRIERVQGLYAWSLTVEHAGESPSVLLSGSYVPGSTAEEGDGEFIYDVTVASSYLDDGSRVGKLAVVYSTLGSEVDLHVDFENVGQTGDEYIVPLRTYEYFTPGDKSGLFYFTSPAQVGSTEALEQVTFWGGWDTTRRGRATVEYTGGDIPSGMLYTAGEECWDSAQDPTYYFQAGDTPVTCGDVASCIPSSRGWNQWDA